MTSKNCFSLVARAIHGRLSPWRLMGVGCWLCLLAATQVSITAIAAEQTYDFEALKAEKPLLGQDGWIGWVGQTNKPAVVNARLSYAMKRETYIVGGGTGDVGSGMAARVNDARFQFAAHDPTNTCAAIQFDVRPSYGDAMFALGAGLTTIAENRIGPQVGFIGRFLVRGAAFGKLHWADLDPADNKNDWYRVRLQMDFTADGGDGRGTMYVMNLSRGERAFRPQPVLKDVPLELKRMEAGSGNPATWDSMFLRCGTSDCQIDNLMPHVAETGVAPAVAAKVKPARLRQPGKELIVADGSRAAFDVVVGPSAGDTTRKAALDLADKLGQMSGATFHVVEGDGARGIAVGTAADLPAWSALAREFGTELGDREAYLMRTHAQGVVLLGARPIGARHAVWDLLHRLGYRQFFPGPVWECVPSLKRVAVKLDVREKPDFITRNIWWRLDSSPHDGELHQDWCEKNRLNFGGPDGTGFLTAGGNMYDAIVASQHAEFEAHPEYVASVKGIRQKPDAADVKFNFANPGLREVVKRYAIEYFEKNPAAECLSLSPSDGGSWDDSPENVRMGSITDRVVGLANEVAEAVNAHFHRPLYVHLYIYDAYSTPPTIKVHPMLIVEQAQGFNTTVYTFDELWELWRKQGVRTGGVYEYLDVFPWSLGFPATARASAYEYLSESVARFKAQQRLIYCAESSRSFGANGRGYYWLSRVLWKVDERQQTAAILDDFVQRAFGPAAGPMGRFYELLERRDLPEFCHERLGQLYGLLAEAWKATDDAAVRARLTDLAAYLHYTDLAMQFNYDIQPLTPQQSVDLAFEITKLGERLRESPMLCPASIWRIFLSAVWHAHPALVPRNMEYDIEWPQNPLKERRPFTPEEVERLISDGQKLNPAPAFTPVSFSKRLVPATPLALPALPRLPADAMSQEWRTLRAYIPEGRTNLVVRVKAGRVPDGTNIGPRLEFYRADRPGLKDENQRYSIRAIGDGEWHPIVLPAPKPGLYVLEISSYSAGSEIDWDPDQLLTDWCEGTTYPKPTQVWSRYFYVPKGTREVVGFSGRTSGGEITDSSGRVLYTFDGKRARLFVIPVPEGQAGMVWRMQTMYAKLLLTVPSALARSPQELLLPEEVVERDRAK